MADLSKLIESLSPEKRKLLELKLKEKFALSNAFPLSYSQQRLWFLYQFEPGSSAYNIPAALRLKGKPDLNALEKSIDSIIGRHEILRTTFTTVNGTPMQVVSDSPVKNLVIVDLSQYPEDKKESILMEKITNESRIPFDLNKGPLRRISLFRLSDTDYALFFVMHHIIADGWSIGLFLKEFSAYYRHFVEESPCHLPELNIQYVDFAKWQRDRLDGKDRDELLHYWKSVLGNHVPVLQFPTDFARPAVKSYNGSRQEIILNRDILNKVKKFSSENSITPYISLLTVFYLLMHRYTNQADITVGTPIANRNRAETENLIGFFVNTLVIRASLSNSDTGGDLLQKVKSAVMGAFNHQDLPFEMLVEELHPERSMNHTPLFQVMFTYQNEISVSMELPGLSMKSITIDGDNAKFDLSFTAAESNGYLSLSFEFDTDLFLPDTIKRMLSHYQLLLLEFLQNPDQNISKLPVLSESEIKTLTHDWNGHTVEFPRNLCLHQIFETSAEANPDQFAVISGNDKMTFDELNSKANRLARHLQKLGAGPESIIAFSMRRSPEMIISILGILKSGGAYLPLDPSYPDERIAFMLKDSGANILITNEHFAEKFKDEKILSVNIDEIPEEDQHGESLNPVIKMDSANLAYIIYTSGTTGQPKGVMIQHRSAINLMKNLDKSIYESFGKNRMNISLNAPISFDASVQQLVMMFSGHSLVIIPEEVRGDGRLMVSYLKNERVDLLDCVPSQLKLLISAGLLNDPEWKPSALLPGGEAIDETTWKMLAELPVTETFNMYGPTECTVDSTICPVRSFKSQPTIGKPIVNARFYILDANNQPVPIGAAGELYIGGEGLARGYLARPSLTGEKFVPDPFSVEPGSRMYKTGDLARYRSDGSIDFIGRIDHQVKVRGFRIELGEIENNIAAHTDVKDAVVVVRESVTGDKQITAYLIPKNVSKPTVPDLRDFLKRKLPDYMLPNLFVWLDEFPRTPNGKIDRFALPEPDESVKGSGAEYIPPGSGSEQKLAEIYSEILGVEKAGANDDFFDLGGHSLFATRLISRIRDEFGVEIPLRTIFENPDIRNLAKSLDMNGSSGHHLSINRVPRTENLPLSFSQTRLWFIDQLMPDNPSYNLQSVYEIKGEFRKDLFEASLKEIMQRHETLRTGIVNLDGKASLRIYENTKPDIQFIDLMAADSAGKAAEADQLTLHEASTPFDLATAPLFRTMLIRLEKNIHRVILTFHHIISDGWSMSIFITELTRIYRAGLLNLNPDLPDLPIQYADYAHWQQHQLTEEYFKKGLDYWISNLSGSEPVIDLPVDRQRPAVPSGKGSFKKFELSESIARKLKQIAENENSTMFMILLSAFSVLLNRYSGQEDISIGSPVANRDRTETEHLIGFFVNTIVLRINLINNPAFTDMLRQVRETALNAFSHQEIPFEKIVDALHPERNTNHTPLFQVMFALQNTPKPEKMDIDLELTPIVSHSGTAKFDLTLFMLEDNDRISGAMEFNTDLFDESTIDLILIHFQNLLESIARNPAEKINRLNMIPENEKHNLLTGWNGIDKRLTLDLPVHRVFEEQARRIPDQIALEIGAIRLSYKQLNEVSNQLAFYLKDLGIGPDRLVGICMERSAEMIISILGILKSGGAYVPIDPSYPKERLAYILDDSNVPVLLTKSGFLRELPDFQGKIIALDSDKNVIQSNPTSNPSVSVEPDHLAYMIYTSGSTGNPKGTMITHRGLTNYLNWCMEAYPLSKGRGSLVHSTIAFDATVTAVFTPILTGSTVTLLPDNSDLESLSKALTEYKNFNVIKITPAHLDLLKHQIAPAEAAGITKAFVIGGENLTTDQIAFWQKNAPETLLFNEYGPTETVVGCVVYEAREWNGSGSVPIGQAILNTRVYALDRYFNTVPTGARGELYIGGAGVARGYLNRPDLTAERFVPDPISGKSGERLYKTGDQVRYLKNGLMEFLGRTDDQIKIRGYRIEPAEIEACVNRHPSIVECVVISREDKPGKKQLAAYMVCGEQQPPSLSELRSFLEDMLPEYMIPAHFIHVDGIPLTANGKVDRKALPKPDDQQLHTGKKYAAPENDNQIILAEIWQELLGLKKIGIHDNFFELGGDSIIIIQIAAKAKQKGLNITPVQFFRYQTIAQLANVASATAFTQAEQGPVTGTLSLTPAQKWFFEQKFPEFNHWNQSVLLSSSQKVDIVSLKKALTTLVNHHDVLRLKFYKTDDSHEARFDDPCSEIPFSLFKISDLSVKEQKNFIESKSALLQASLNIETGPVFRFGWFETGETAGKLLMIVHHLIIDGISWRILLDDLQTAYGQIINGGEIQLPAKTTSFREWSKRLRSFTSDKVSESDLKYWLNLSKVPLNTIPVDFPDGANTESSVSGVQVSLNQDETRALLQVVPAVYNTQINDILLTALALSYSARTGKRSVWITMEGHGRESLFEDIDISRTLGWFTSLFPVHLELGKSVTPGDCIKSVKEQLRKIPRAGLSYGLLRYLDDTDSVKQQLKAIENCPISFNYLGQFDQNFSKDTPFMPADEQSGSERGPNNPRATMIDIIGTISGNTLKFLFNYSINLHREETIRQFSANFINELRKLIIHCQSPDAGDYTASDFKLAGLSDEKLNKVLDRLNHTKGNR
ncbi:MAG: amino acid adenylation domain-containing protein [Calditrichaceae bacterium]